MNVSNKYRVELVDLTSIKPSPENDDIYGKVVDNNEMETLTDSIRSIGLEEPIIVSQDGFIVSGHRRYAACKKLAMAKVPVRRKTFTRGTRLDEWHRILAEYNPQRVKTAGMLLREAMAQDTDLDPRLLLQSYRQLSEESAAEFCKVEGLKSVRPISAKKQEFLAAAKKVVAEMEDFWPLSVRQIHYQMLNNAPLISRPKTTKYDLEHYRYRNDDKSYKALIELLKQARYTGEISMHCIDDPTRPQFRHNGHESLSAFIRTQMECFLNGYHRDRQLDQPRHIEVLGEKNTLTGIVKPICQEYYVPLSLGRGYGSVPLWRDMASRFKRSKRSVMTLISVSDFDPEGMDLPRDGIRTLRDMWGIPVDHHRVSVNREQIEELSLAEDFNVAKDTSSRFKQFVEETGGSETWEVESLPPKYLQQQLRSAIEANMDMELYELAVKAELNDANELSRIRKEIINDLNF